MVVSLGVHIVDYCGFFGLAVVLLIAGLATAIFFGMIFCCF